VLQPAYPIETQRLVIRPLEVADADELAVYQSLADVCRYIPYEPRGREQIAERIADPARTKSALEKEGEGMWLAVEHRDSGGVIGDVVLIWTSEEHQCAEIGYVFNPDVRGNGYATEACRALLALAFDELKVRRVIARIDARNDASAAVLRRLGMRQEAYLVQNEFFKGEWTDEVDFALLETEWRAGFDPGRGPAPDIRSGPPPESVRPVLQN
jgi:RimJ/RimL family protein N-acetyltransferase